MITQNSIYLEAEIIHYRMFNVCDEYKLYAYHFVILEKLMKQQYCRNRDLRLADLSPAGVSKFLRKLRKRGYININDDRKYFITFHGKQLYYEMLEKLKISEKSPRYAYGKFAIRPSKKKSKKKTHALVEY